MGQLVISSRATVSRGFYFAVLCSHLEGNPKFQFKSRGKIFIKGLGDRQTYFVELADHGSDAVLPESGEPGGCQLIKVPALTRQHNPSTFPEERKGGSGLHRPTVVDMVKPQAPLEEAWSKLTPSPSARTSTGSFRSDSQQGTTRVTRVTPSPETAGSSGEGAAQKSNRSMFIGSSPSSASATDPPLKPERNKSKCTLC